jgi:uncharacterized protein YycO
MKVFFAATDSVYGVGIRRFEGGDYNHTGFILPNGKVVEAVDGEGVIQRESIATISDNYSKLVIYDLVVPNEAAGLRFIQEQLGKKYDRLAILGILLQRNWQNDSAWYCSELLAAWYLHAGLAIAGAEKYNRVPVRLTHAVTHALHGGQALVLR